MVSGIAAVHDPIPELLDEGEPHRRVPVIIKDGARPRYPVSPPLG